MSQECGKATCLLTIYNRGFCCGTSDRCFNALCEHHVEDEFNIFFIRDRFSDTLTLELDKKLFKDYTIFNTDSILVNKNIRSTSKNFYKSCIQDIINKCQVAIFIWDGKSMINEIPVILAYSRHKNKQRKNIIITQNKNIFNDYPWLSTCVDYIISKDVELLVILKKLFNE